MEAGDEGEEVSTRQRRQQVQVLGSMMTGGRGGKDSWRVTAGGSLSSDYE